MSAWDTFWKVTASLTERERESLKEIIANQRGDLLAARSEDARVRLVTDFVREVRESQKQLKR
jgi:hypothetical protein